MKEISGHDIQHLNRVLDNAMRIQEVEGGDLYVVSVSTLVHDFHKLMSNQKKVYI